MSLKLNYPTGWMSTVAPAHPHSLTLLDRPVDLPLSSQSWSMECPMLQLLTPDSDRVLPMLKDEPTSPHLTPVWSSTSPSSHSASSPESISSPATPQNERAEHEAAWRLVPYDVPWGDDFMDYKAGVLPGPEGDCLFLRSPTPVEKRRAAQACEMCRERKAKCSGDRPACARCLERGYDCFYAPEARRTAAPTRRKAAVSCDYRPYPHSKPRAPRTSPAGSRTSSELRRSPKREELDAQNSLWDSSDAAGYFTNLCTTPSLPRVQRSALVNTTPATASLPPKVEPASTSVQIHAPKPCRLSSTASFLADATREASASHIPEPSDGRPLCINASGVFYDSSGAFVQPYYTQQFVLPEECIDSMAEHFVASTASQYYLGSTAEMDGYNSYGPQVPECSTFHVYEPVIHPQDFSGIPSHALYYSYDVGELAAPPSYVF